jgi:hypothetical protein
LRTPYTRLKAWLDRDGAVGHGERSGINAKGAIAVAREATPADAIDDAPLPTAA